MPSRIWLARLGSNYLPDPKLATITNQPNVTMRLENVTAQDALTAVLDTYNLQIIHDPRIKVSRITVKDPKAEDPLFSRIIQLKYTQPTNIVDILKRTLQSPRSQVMGDPRTSQLIVVATEKEFPAVDELVARLDTPTRQVLIEAQIWETAKNPKSVKGIDWGGTFENQKVTWGNGANCAGRNHHYPPGHSEDDDHTVRIVHIYASFHHDGIDNLQPGQRRHYGRQRQRVPSRNRFPQRRRFERGRIVLQFGQRHRSGGHSPRRHIGQSAGHPVCDSRFPDL